MNGRPRDSQRLALYRWERGMECFTWEEELTLDECQRLVADVWHEHAPSWGYVRQKPPTVVDGRGSRKGRASRRRIHLPRQCRFPGCVVHETAHALIAVAELGEQVQLAPHGPEFARLYLSLLGRWCGASKRRQRSRALHDREKGTRRVHFATLDEVRALGLRNL